jgi:hypothetical protein
MHTPTRPGTRTHARACTHTQANKWYLFLFHGNNDSRRHISVTLYVYCLTCWYSRYWMYQNCLWQPSNLKSSVGISLDKKEQPDFSLTSCFHTLSRLEILFKFDALQIKRRRSYCSLVCLISFLTSFYVRFHKLWHIIITESFKYTARKSGEML